MPRKPPPLETLRCIAEEIPTPFHLYDAEGIRENVRELQRAFAWNPGFTEYFAVKATPNPSILRLLKELGCGVDCASYTELLLAHEVGFRGDEIMFSSNATPAEDFLLARELDAIINLDDISHIDFLAEHGGIPERVSLRYNPGGDFRLGTRVMGNPAEAKFGLTPEQMPVAIRRLQELGVEEFGLHSFLASNTTDADYYPTIARMLFELAADLHRDCGAEFFLVNLSGGIGIPYEPDQPRADLAYIGREVERAYAETIVPAGMDPLSVVTELGRFITGPNGWLVATAVHEKDTHKHYLGLDASASNLMRPSMYGAYHHITVAGKEDAPAERVYDVTGALCENNDKFAIDRALPEIEIGDLVVLHDSGAHGHSMGHNYNGKLRSAEVLLEPDGCFRLIRRAETPRDYFATVAGIDVPEELGAPEHDPLQRA
ncbi:diaminopimelate decarboxylase [Gulosibacter sp. 10]|uniref:diaminopimelate decarboxylase n=1 Tax=Gulosibacter sp. 10 TaxID=1255570 RepID=UPI00097ED363|nr:diaminopimelate decarboxylase [Gulosibacter sp. 10]SJM49202.1 Diaminopimelate decarboxylase [Gulosibacter sp. 10]